jgi:y4mF family transcriptional regulator
MTMSSKGKPPSRDLGEVAPRLSPAQQRAIQEAFTRAPLMVDELPSAIERFNEDKVEKATDGLHQPAAARLPEGSEIPRQKSSADQSRPQCADAVASRALCEVALPADLGRLVRTARKNMKLTQQRFADLAGVGRRFISELEAGKATLELGKALEVCRAAGIDVFARPR